MPCWYADWMYFTESCPREDRVTASVPLAVAWTLLDTSAAPAGMAVVAVSSAPWAAASGESTCWSAAPAGLAVYARPIFFALSSSAASVTIPPTTPAVPLLTGKADSAV